MTDVTGFGLLGHLAEMCEGSGLSATIEFDKVPVIPTVYGYLEKGCIPGGTGRNWASYGNKIRLHTTEQKHVLADPQTSGGLLIAVTPDGAPELERMLRQNGLPADSCTPFGRLMEKQDTLISVVS